MNQRPEAEGDYREGIRWLVLINDGVGNYCAYIGIPGESPAAGIHHDDVAVPVHGGWTWSGRGDDHIRPAGWFWWGWDYAHLGDALPRWAFPDEHLWTLEEVVAEVKTALPLFEAWLRVVTIDKEKS